VENSQDHEPSALVFEWNEVKAKANAAKHGVDFEEARTIFNDPQLLTFEDFYHSEHEQRYLSLGISSSGRLLIAAHTGEDNVIRLINCRPTTRRERRTYEERR
jgi:uncharacterized DUF497 family protein